MLFTGFGFVTLTIAMIGLYSILAYAVAQRTREIGIRLALGASAGRLARGIVARGMALVLAGVGAGLAVAWFAVRPLEGILIQSGGSEGRGLLMVVGLLAGVSLLAILVPASRATRIDPMLALRDG
jgi:ABC-type antimicrobial peptide transport system permease subunit